MSIWAVIFAGMSATQGVGDNHPGQWLPFWRQACEDGRAYACPYTVGPIWKLRSAIGDSGWACNEAGLLHIALYDRARIFRRQPILQ